MTHSDQDSLIKVYISKQADQCLDSMLTQVNENFPSGKVKRSHLVNWLIQYFEKREFKKLIPKIQNDHFDKIHHLRSILKKLEEAKRADQTIEIDDLLNPLKTQGSKDKSKPESEP